MTKYRKDIKLVARYVILVYLMYLCHYVIQPETIELFKGIPDIVGSAIIASPYAALTLVLKAHFDSKIDQES